MLRWSAGTVSTSKFWFKWDHTLPGSFGKSDTLSHLQGHRGKREVSVGKAWTDSRAAAWREIHCFTSKVSEICDSRLSDKDITANAVAASLISRPVSDAGFLFLLIDEAGQNPSEV